ncbi:dicarboxylate/amino acid:cation symporter [Anaerococcus sp. AGMB00486]|uniref:Dicarboxylate/amino acid:cation symporter n=1 Tax=Anaerococcus faecalis TaxID=2742993 RepID=A0ABX2N8T8_9FIRM|nr:dicarboxylate/amino acid:cation symporter [Anaerococcus faecalis]NVF11116.1 dicarboxylate/amino acid:cation symporter [Anaerococcus faecalis]
MTRSIKKMSIVNKMVISLIFGFLLGGLLIIIRERLGTESDIWKFINTMFLVDVTKSKGFDGVGILYIISQLFMRGLQLAIVPLVLTSLTLAISSLGNPKKLGSIAIKTLFTFVCFYIIIAFLAGVIAMLIKNFGGFDVNLPTHEATELTTMEAYNPLTVLINAVPDNIFNALTFNNQILSVVVISSIMGVCIIFMGDYAEPIEKLFDSFNELIQKYLNFLINYISPFAILCMVTRALAVYGVEYIKPTLVWMVATTLTSILLLLTIYPIGILLTTKLNPLPFMKKISKVALFAAATNSSAATLPINVKTCNEELGCSEEITSFVLPTGMTINMNGTTLMHMISITFIGTAAGIEVTSMTLIVTGFLSICMAIGTPAIPVAGTTMVYVVMSGLGWNSELAMIGYSLVLAMNYLPGMAVITLNVVGDATTNVIINKREGELDEDVYYN